MSIATQIERLQGVRNQIRAKMVALGLSENTDLLQNLADDLDKVALRGDASTTLDTSTRSKTLDAGYYTGGTIKVPDDYFPINSTNTTAAAGDVLSGKTFVGTSGSTVTGTIATASSSDVSGNVKGTDPTKITLTAAKTLGSSSTTATAKAIVTKGLYTGSSNIEKDLTSKTLTATAEATLANTNGAVSITAGTSDIVKTSTGDYSNGFITKVTVSPTPSEEQTATPSNTTQTVTPKAGKLLSKVTVNAIPSPYFNTSGVTATAGTVLKDYKFVDSSGATVTGTIVSRGDASATLSTSTRSKTLSAGYYTGGTIKVPDNYYPLTSSNTTATGGTVLSGYKFVNTSGSTVTGTIATATSRSVSGSVSGSDPSKITLTTAKTSGSSSTTATAEATVTKGLYTGSSNIVADLTSKDFTATAEATLATSVTGSTTVPSTLPAGTVEITPNTDNTKRIYSDSKNKGFITNVVLKPMSTSSVTVPDPNKDPGTDYTNQVTVTPSGTSAKYVKITAGHLPNSKITIEKMAGGSVASATTTKPDTSSTSYPNQTTVTPTKTTQYVKITAGYLPNSKITVDAIPSTTLTVAENAWTKLTSATELGSYSQTVTGVTGVLTDNDVVVAPGDPSMVALYGVYASGQGASSITFKAFDKPTSDMSYKVYILNK